MLKKLYPPYDKYYFLDSTHVKQSANVFCKQHELQTRDTWATSLTWETVPIN